MSFPIPVQLWIYTRTGTFKTMYQAGSSPLMSVSFTHTERGCGDFSLEFNAAVNIYRSDLVKIDLYNGAQDFFFGVTRQIPVPGSTLKQFIYSGYGLNDYLVRINTEAKTYTSKTLSYIVNDLVDTVIVLKSPITKDAAKISLPAITVTSLTINYEQMDSVLGTLKQIADSTGDEYVYGVDAEGDFFFRPRSTATVVTLVLGKSGAYGIQTYEPEEEAEAQTKLFVLDKDGVYQFALTSTSNEDPYEEKIRGPDISNTDLLVWAQGYLAKAEQVRRSAVVDWPVEDETPLLLTADGKARIIASTPPTSYVQADHFWDSGNWDDNGPWDGGVYTGYDLEDILAIMEVAYTVDQNGASRRLSLGVVPKRLEADIVAVNRKLVSLEVSLGV